MVIPPVYSTSTRAVTDLYCTATWSIRYRGTWHLLPRKLHAQGCSILTTPEVPGPLLLGELRTQNKVPMGLLLPLHRKLNGWLFPCKLGTTTTNGRWYNPRFIVISESERWLYSRPKWELRTWSTVPMGLLLLFTPKTDWVAFPPQVNVGTINTNRPVN